MNLYQQEQYDAHALVLRYLATIDDAQKQQLDAMLHDYLAFRRRVDAFLQCHFARTCTQACFQSRRSACCSREGIITFFADVVINVLGSPSAEIARTMARLRKAHSGYKCIYLSPAGCRWKIKPMVCAMFLCDTAQNAVFNGNPALQDQWESIRKEKDRFTWPSQPVLFDDLEAHFIKAGFSSPLMYMHNSPGLLRLKRKWSVSSPPP
jgi:hypothetical protein